MEGSVQAKETQVGWRHVSWGLGIFTVEVVSEKKTKPKHSCDLSLSALP